MAKLKTHKSVVKRVKITKQGKLLVRKGGQDHFNSRDRGVKTMGKRRDITLSKTETKNIKRLLPYS